MSDTIIDDQDLSHVHYNGSWIRGGSSIEHDETVASSTVVGDYFTVDFYGNAITVYGTIDITSGGVLTNYSVDSASAEQMSAQAGQGDTSNQQFWKSPTLDVGEHRLVVTMARVNNITGQPGEGTIWFDYFRVTDPTIRSTLSARKAHKVGGIVGGVVGGVILAALVIFHFLKLRRIRRKKAVKPQAFHRPKEEFDSESSSPSNIGHSTSDQEVITPFPFGQVHARSGPNLPPTTDGAIPTSASGLPRKMAIQHRSQVSDPASPVAQPMSSHAPSSPSEESGRVATLEGTIQNASGKPSPGIVNIIAPQATTSSTLSLGQLSQPMQHIDSGVRAINIQTDDISTTGIELPPVYSPV